MGCFRGDRDEEDIHFHLTIAGSTCKGTTSRRKKTCNRPQLFSSREYQRKLRQGESLGRRGSIRVRFFQAAEPRVSQSNPAVAAAAAHAFCGTNYVAEISFPISRFRITGVRS